MTARPEPTGREGVTPDPHPMTDLTTLRALLGRVEAATGPDRELDHDIFDALTGLVSYRPREFETELWSEVGRYTASIDADVALIEQVLRGWIWEIASEPGGKYAAMLWTPWLDKYEPVGCGQMRDPTIALVAALFKALISRAEHAAETGRE